MLLEQRLESGESQDYLKLWKVKLVTNYEPNVEVGVQRTSNYKGSVLNGNFAPKVADTYN